MKYSSYKRFGHSCPFFLTCWYITLAGKVSLVCRKTLWPPRTGGPIEKAPEAVILVSSSSIFPARSSTWGHRVSPQQLVTVKHLQGSCCVFPNNCSCKSIAVCWGTEQFFIQLCSTGHFLMKWGETADSTVTETLARWQPKVVSAHTLNWTPCPSFDPQLLPLTLSNKCKHSPLLQYSFSYFSSSGEDIPPSLLLHTFVYLLKKWTHLVGGWWVWANPWEGLMKYSAGLW